jgi:hypothetical protein
VQEYAQLDIVTDRLPTEEETWNGKALIFVDTEKYPDAKPLDLNLPRIARIQSGHNGLNELIIVFQAIVVGNDSVVGYRFPSGGNGSAWLGEVTFLSEEEIEAVGSAPFVFMQEDIDATRAEIWKAFTKTEYAKSLGKKFNEQAFFKSEWTDESRISLNLETENEMATGYVANVWGNLYMQIDYDYDGFHYTEKMMVGVNQETETPELLFVSGPYPKDFESQDVLWENWSRSVSVSVSVSVECGVWVKKE